MSGLFAEFDKACKPVRKYRHKRVGHNDLNSTIKPHDNPLPTVSREQIDKILNLASDILNTILNTIYKHFVIDSELHFDPFYLGGADTLLYYLRKGRESQRIGFKGTVNHESCIVFGCPRQAAYNVKNAAVLAD